jgi:urea transport system ATP-binding protein
MSDHETEKTIALIRGIAGPCTVIAVEHDMAFVRELGFRTTVLHEGRVLAEGSVEAVQANPRVIEVYLGR